MNKRAGFKFFYNLNDDEYTSRGTFIDIFNEISKYQLHPEIQQTFSKMLIKRRFFSYDEFFKLTSFSNADQLERDMILNRLHSGENIGGIEQCEIRASINDD